MMKTFARPRLLVLALYIAGAALVTVQQAILRHSNNVSIFRSASFNLFAGRDLYAAHPEQHFDFYKYSPTFAVLFAPLAYLPFALTFLCWTLLNGLLLWYALDRLLPEREATVALALLYLEVLLALQYGQSNALVAALMVLAFVAFEARRPVGAAVSITLGAAVKLFPLAALSVAVFHPRRLRSPPSSSRYSPPPSLCRSWPSRPATCWRSTARGTPSRRRTRCAAATRSCTTCMLGSEWTGPTGRCRPPALRCCCSRSRCARTAGRASSSGVCSCARCSSTRSCSITPRSPHRSWSPTRGS